jgi:hypothetical protein
MRTIYKYQIPVEDTFSLDLPANSKVLTAQTQRQVPCIWVEIDSQAPKHPREFRLVGTGHPMRYIGSFQMLQETLIFHLYEVTE